MATRHAPVSKSTGGLAPGINLIDLSAEQEIEGMHHVAPTRR
jgi:hypothetical protein